jgi:hypothetical protein
MTGLLVTARTIDDMQTVVDALLKEKRLSGCYAEPESDKNVVCTYIDSVAEVEKGKGKEKKKKKKKEEEEEKKQVEFAECPLDRVLDFAMEGVSLEFGPSASREQTVLLENLDNIVFGLLSGSGKTTLRMLRYLVIRIVSLAYEGSTRPKPSREPLNDEDENASCLTWTTLNMYMLGLADGWSPHRLSSPLLLQLRKGIEAEEDGDYSCGGGECKALYCSLRTCNDLDCIVQDCESSRGANKKRKKGKKGRG